MSSGGTVAGNPHDVHFLPGLAQSIAPFELQKALVTQLATFPLGTSSGGFTYTLDPATGAIAPASRSFGPSFAERPLTIGEGKFTTGIQYQHVEFDAFEGADLDGDEITFALPHNNCCPAGANDPTAPGNTVPFFEGDLVEIRPALKAKTDTTVVFANYGVTNDLEVGVAVPFVRASLNVEGRSTIVRLSTGAQTNIHSFDGSGSTEKVIPAVGGSATGIGDVLVRAKYLFVRRSDAGVAGEIGVRLPTGDESDLLGTGGTQTRLLFIAAMSRGDFSPHVNLGYVLSSGTVSSGVTDFEIPAGSAGDPIRNLSAPDIDLSVPDEFHYTGGFDWAVSPRVTFAADVIGRVIRNVMRFESGDSTFQFRTANDSPIQTNSRPTFNLDGTRNLNLLLGAVGAKFNVATNLLLTANVLFPLSDSGLKPRVTPVIGLDYAF